jgi:hypothetical protein
LAVTEVSVPEFEFNSKLRGNPQHSAFIPHPSGRSSTFRTPLNPVRRALRANQKAIEANRLMAQLADKNRLPETFLLRGRVLDLAPSSIDDRLALVRVAILPATS